MMALVTQDLFKGTIDKVAIAIDRIRAFEPPEGYYVAFSGGKDSVVILDLVKRSGVKYDAHYNLTTVDPPELVKFIKTFPEVHISRPEKNMWELIAEKGFPPTRRIRYCCEYLKESGGRDRIVVTGVRWAESSRRSKRKMVEACYRNAGKHYLHPIIDWSDDDVWNYIKQNGVRYCHLYDEGFRRLGCVGCPMGGSGHMERGLGRWPKFKAAYIRAFDKAIRRRREAGKKIIHETGLEMFDWWIQETKRKVDPDQTVMFE